MHFPKRHVLEAQSELKRHSTPLPSSLELPDRASHFPNLQVWDAQSELKRHSTPLPKSFELPDLASHFPKRQESEAQSELKRHSTPLASSLSAEKAWLVINKLQRVSENKNKLKIFFIETFPFDILDVSF